MSAPSDFFYQIIFKLQSLYLTIRSWFIIFSRRQKIALAVLVILLLPMYFIASGAAQWYFSYRYQDLVIEAHTSFMTPTALRAEPVTVIVLPDGNYAAYAKVDNVNLDLAAPEVSYRLEFANQSGDTIATRTGKLFFLPNQTRYILVPRLVSSEQVSSARLSFEPVTWQRRLGLPQVTLTTSLPEVLASPDSNGSSVQGTVTNNSPYSLKSLDLAFLVYGTAGKVIAVSQRQEFDLKPFERRAYAQVLPAVLENAVVRVAVSAATNTLDPNTIRIDSPGASGSGLNRPTNE
jgi:hypothetical protein